MKAVAAHPLLIECLRNGEMVRDRGMAAVEGGVEAGHLGQLRQASAQDLDRGEIVGLMQGRQRDQGLDPGNDRIVNEDRCGEASAAMDDPMADGRRHLAAKLLRQPVEDMIEGGGGIAELLRPPCLVDQALSILGSRR